MLKKFLYRIFFLKGTLYSTNINNLYKHYGDEALYLAISEDIGGIGIILLID